MHTVRVRPVALLALLAGCAELGVVGDGTSISVGKPNRGHIVDGTRMPDRGEGFFTREVWKTRGQRYGTDELIDLLTAVSRRMTTRVRERLVIADLSGRGGGAAYTWHRSHQSGRDVDLLYYVRDRDGKAVEPDAMRVFGPDGKAKDGSGYTVDIPRTWLLVREIITAPEAPVQWVFMYEPIAAKLVEHAIATHEPEVLVAKVRFALRQPGNSAPHNDHMHVRVYCAKADKPYGCLDIGPMDLMAERDAELAAMGGTLPPITHTTPAPRTSSAPSAPSSDGTSAGAPIKTDLRSIGRLLRNRTDRIPLRLWR